MLKKILVAMTATAGLALAATFVAPIGEAAAGGAYVGGYVSSDDGIIEARMNGPRHRSHRSDRWNRRSMNRCRAPVHAKGVAAGYGPMLIKRFRARRRAIRNWRDKVAYRYGYHFDRWRRARARDVVCDRYAGRFHCTVKARPCRGGRFSISY